MGHLISFLNWLKDVFDFLYLDFEMSSKMSEYDILIKILKSNSDFFSAFKSISLFKFYSLHLFFRRKSCKFLSVLSNWNFWASNCICEWTKNYYLVLVKIDGQITIIDISLGNDSQRFALVKTLREFATKFYFETYWKIQLMVRTFKCNLFTT